MHDIAERYLEALASADVDAVLALFASDGVVHSPLYGTRSAREFYPLLFADTAESRLTLRQVFRGGERGVAFWFDFDWTLRDGTPAPFTVVDVAELDGDGLIARLHIVYDTAPLRASFDNATVAKRQ